jgi:hypothetical protein
MNKPVSDLLDNRYYRHRLERGQIDGYSLTIKLNREAGFIDSGDFSFLNKAHFHKFVTEELGYTSVEEYYENS